MSSRSTSWKKKRRRVVAEPKNTFGAAVRDFIEEHARQKTRRWRETAKLLGLFYPNDGSNPVEVQGGLASNWRERVLADISDHDVFSVIDEARRHGVPGRGIRNKKVSDARGRALARALSRMFSWLVQHRRVSVSPCTGVYCPPPPQARDRILKPEEIRLFWAACENIGHPFAPLFKLLLLTGSRREEVARMRRAEISEDGRTWSLSASRTKNRRPHDVPLSGLVREILSTIKQISGSNYMFSTNGRTPVSGFSRVKVRLDREMNKTVQVEKEPMPRWTLHDLRRTAATGMAEIGIAPHVVEAVINHVSGAREGVAGTYNRAAYVAEKRAALEAWAAHVEALVHRREAQAVLLRSVQ